MKSAKEQTQLDGLNGGTTLPAEKPAWLNPDIWNHLNN